MDEEDIKALENTETLKFIYNMKVTFRILELMEEIQSSPISLDKQTEYANVVSQGMDDFKNDPEKLLRVLEEFKENI